MPLAPPSVSLCLACSASLPPRTEDSKVFHTPCCSRPICPTCVAANPRLTRYNPCLLCLAGANAVNPGSSFNVGGGMAARTNVDGSVRDEDVFVLEDEDEDEDYDLETDQDTLPKAPEAGLKLSEEVGGLEADESKSPSTLQEAGQPSGGGRSMPFKYFIRPEDTLIGLSLKLGVDGRVLCRLNNLPASTLRTTPHLLHTRSYLILPPSASTPPLTATEQALDDERRARIAVERAHTRFQSMTKETNRDVAKAYVALASLPDDDLPMTGDVKEYDKDKGLGERKTYMPEAGLGESSLEGRAVDRYFDDDEWEARERAEGRKVTIPSFPLFGRAAEKQPAEEQKPWWRWRN